MPETILALTFTGITIFNTTKLFEFKGEIPDSEAQIVQHFVLIFVLLILIIFDMALRVSKLNSQVYNVDTEVKRTLTEF